MTQYQTTSDPVVLHHGNSLDILKLYPDNHFDSIVTDPPYGLKFMARKWDYDVPSQEIWEECLRVLKPGGFLLAFAGTRTQHRMAVRIEDAGFEIRDLIAWVYGSGFPKSMDLAKASGDEDLQGWGTALKPALEPITIARKPFKGTLIANVDLHGTGGMNIDGCRIHKTEPSRDRTGEASKDKRYNKTGGTNFSMTPRPRGGSEAGRWPANLIHDGSDNVVELFPSKAGAAAPVKGTEPSLASEGTITGKRERVSGAFHADSGSAARFFYCAKASSTDRNEGCDDLKGVSAGDMTGGRKEGSAGLNSPRAGAGRTSGGKNDWPTVKPTELMRWLQRLVTPEGGVTLDPFCGSGSSVKSAIKEGFQIVAIDLDAHAIEITEARASHALGRPVVRRLARPADWDEDLDGHWPYDLLGELITYQTEYDDI